ncbi:MAG: hypothetical protein L3J56_05310, partial [Bacteroidales bacterium]|nr:hypothetical protein [Bacteroidales bacterium]
MDKGLLFDEGQIIAKGKASDLINSVKEYTYIETDCKEECFSFNKRTYSLRPLPVAHAQPDLESVFFVNALTKYKNITEIKLNE